MTTTVTKAFAYTGAMQTFTVPLSVTSVIIVCNGASGASWGGAGGGTGANVVGTLAVTGGQVLNLFVGGGGGSSSYSVPGAGGWNGGGGGAPTAGQPNKAAGAGGGGAADVRSGGTAIANRIMIAGGGGGATNGGNGGYGGALGTTAGNGSSNGGYGGTQSAGGAGGAGVGGAGSAGFGGIGAGNSINDGPGGGGGGYYGGGGGGWASGGVTPGSGGGGSSYQTGFTSTSWTAGIAGGNPYTGTNNDAYITITYTNHSPTAATPTNPANYGYADVENAVIWWTFNDPDTGDFQGAADVRYRVNGGPWLSIYNAVGQSTSTYVISGLTVGMQYEWQVRTYDFLGEQAPWSASSFFTCVAHPTPVSFASPTPGQAITNLSTQYIDWINAVRNQSGYFGARYGVLADGTIDTTTVYESGGYGDSSGNTRVFTNTAVHRNGPEFWSLQLNAYNNTVFSDTYNFPVTMAYDIPQAPLCTATALPNSGAIQVVAKFVDLSTDYYSKATVPTVSDTGQSLTSFGTPAMNGTTGNGMLFNNLTVFGQTANVGAKVLSMSATFNFHDSAATHANSITMYACDSLTSFANAHIFCKTTRTGWSISKLVGGTTTVLASGSYAQLLPGPATPLTMSASVSGTTITFVDPFGIAHTATDAIIGSQTNAIARVSVDNTGTTTPDKIQLAHWSASDSANVPVYATLDRSTDGVNFTPIPGAAWDSQDFGAVLTYIDYAAPFNTRVYYRATAYTLAGGISRSVIS